MNSRNAEAERRNAGTPGPNLRGQDAADPTPVDPQVLDWSVIASLGHDEISGMPSNVSAGARGKAAGFAFKVHAAPDEIAPELLVPLDLAAARESFARDMAKDRRRAERERRSQAEAKAKDWEVQEGRDLGTKPTRRAAEKMRTSRIASMAQRGAIDHVHARAAEEIETVFMAMSRGMSLKAQSYGHLPGGSKVVRDPLSRMTASEGRAYRDRYRPWVALMEMAPVALRRENCKSLILFPCALAVTVMITCDNASMDETEKACGLRRGEAAKLLKLALNRYCQISGWTSGPVWMASLAMRLEARRHAQDTNSDVRG